MRTSTLRSRVVCAWVIEDGWHIFTLLQICTPNLYFKYVQKHVPYFIQLSQYEVVNFREIFKSKSFESEGSETCLSVKRCQFSKLGTAYAKGGFKSEDTGKSLGLQHKYSKSLSWAENLDKLFTVFGGNFKSSAQDTDLEYSCWRRKNSPVSSDLKPPL